MDHSRFLELVSSYSISQSLVTALKIGIFEALGKKSLSTKGVARMLKLNEEACGRLLLMLSKLGLIEYDSGKYYNSEYVTSHLLETANDNLLAWIDYSVRFMRLWQCLPSAIRTGRPQWQRHGESSMWQSFFEDEVSKAILVRSFEPFARELGKTISKSITLPKNCIIMDLGGGSGHALIEVIKANPGVKGVLFDLPTITPFATDSFLAAQLADATASVVSGDFLVDELVYCDVIIMGWILHNWSDEQTTTILMKCHHALPKNGILLVAETVLDPQNVSIYDAISSLDMLLSTNGRERSIEELEDLFKVTGFEIERTVETNHHRTLIILHKRT